jgi:hypothetical protein
MIVYALARIAQWDFKVSSCHISLMAIDLTFCGMPGNMGAQKPKHTVRSESIITKMLLTSEDHERV